MELSYHLNDIRKAASEFLEVSGDNRIFAFHGGMGAGKTTFIHAICDALGVKDVVGSPTFSIINEYIFAGNEGARKVYHIDLYRIKDEKEAMLAGVEDCFYTDAYCFIEWPEKAGSLIPPDTMHVNINVVDEKTRRIRTDEQMSKGWNNEQMNKE